MSANTFAQSAGASLQEAPTPDAPSLERVKSLAEQLPRGDIEKLVVELHGFLNARETPVSLHGMFKAELPDVDIIPVIREIRDEWKKKFEDME